MTARPGCCQTNRRITQFAQLAPPADGRAYDLSSAPKYYVEFDGAGHLAWTDLGHEYRTLIVRYSVAFFERYLKDATGPDPLAPLIAKPVPKDVSAVEFLPDQPSPALAGGR